MDKRNSRTINYVPYVEKHKVPNPITNHLVVDVSDALLAKVVSYASDLDISRSEAIRRLIELGWEALQKRRGL